MDDHAKLDQDAGFIYGIFKAELGGYCAHVKLAVKALEDGIKLHRPTHAWFGAQAVLTAAGNASKLLWADKEDPDGFAALGRARLRAAAEITNASPLRDRAVRNAFEHIDERIITWVGAGGSQFGSRTVEWRDGDEFMPPTTTKFGVLHADSWVVEFPDTKFVSIKDLAAEFDRISAAVRPF